MAPTRRTGLWVPLGTWHTRTSSRHVTHPPSSSHLKKKLPIKQNMNATSAGDACHPHTSCIPGTRRPGSRMKRMHTTSTIKTPQQESTPHTTPEDPTTPKESVQHPELRTTP